MSSIVALSGADPRVEIAEFLGVPLANSISVEGALDFIDEPDLRQLVLERPPFFLINRAVVLGTNTILAVAHISIARCAGHFPERPIVPLIRMCECAAQSGVVLVARNVMGRQVPIAVGSGESVALTKEFVRPPVTIFFHSRKVRAKMGLFVVDSEFYVNGEKVGSLLGIRYLAPQKEQVFLA